VSGARGSNVDPSDPSESPTPPRLDSQGRYWSRGHLSYAIIGTYAFLVLLSALILPRSQITGVWWAPWAIIFLLAFFLVRYLSTYYLLDDVHLRAWRLAGGRRLRLDKVHRIEYASLRDLSPTGFFGSWGWRGRMWSPAIGKFDSVYTEASFGLLVTADAEPLYISPTDPQAFARELSRRVRSFRGDLTVDVGAPGAAPVFRQ
jgi:hypothetical protein